MSSATTTLMIRGWAVLLLATVIAMPAVSSAADTPPDRRAVRPGAVAPVAPPRESLVDLLLQVESLETELRKLRGEIEVQRHELERLRARQRDVIEDMDRRLREIERRGAPAAAAATPTAPAVADAAPESTGDVSALLAPKAPATAAPSGEQQKYDAAFALMKQGYYERAAKAFEEFIAGFPNSLLADNAQYWIGEAHYVVRNFKRALDEFNKVLTQFPNSPKAGDALLKVGYSHYELGEWDKARVALSQVIARHPNTSVAKSAELRLTKIAQEGH